MLGTKFAVLLLVLAALVLGSIQFAQWKKRAAIEQEVAALKQEAEQLEKRNKEISDSLAFLGRAGATERIARQQLNLKKEGEIVVNFGDEPMQEQEVQTGEQEPKNAALWWEYFFE